MDKNRNPYFFVFLSALFFGISPPIAKLLIKDIAPVALAGLLYLGSFLGLSLYSMFSRKLINPKTNNKIEELELADIPWLVGAIITGGIIAPICMMVGLNYITGFTASLMLNLEGLATVIIAVFFFRENAGKRLWIALVCMTMAGILLSWEPYQGIFSIMGSFLLVFAMFCWGIDNNLTRKISGKNAVQIAQIKGLAAGTTSMLIAYSLGVGIHFDLMVLFALILGALSYGVSLVLFIEALKGLGSARTGTLFSIAPFLGALVSIVILKEWMGWVMVPAAALMIVGTYLLISEGHLHLHRHENMTHSHFHAHDDIHHLHGHPGTFYKVGE